MEKLAPCEKKAGSSKLKTDRSNFKSSSSFCWLSFSSGVSGAGFNRSSAGTGAPSRPSDKDLLLVNRPWGSASGLAADSLAGLCLGMSFMTSGALWLQRPTPGALCRALVSVCMVGREALWPHPGSADGNTAVADPVIGPCCHVAALSGEAATAMPPPGRDVPSVAGIEAVRPRGTDFEKYAVGGVPDVSSVAVASVGRACDGCPSKRRLASCGSTTEDCPATWTLTPSHSFSKFPECVRRRLDGGCVYKSWPFSTQVYQSVIDLFSLFP